MKKRIMIISSIIILSLVIIGIYSTFASDETTVRDNTYNITLTGNSNELTVPAGSSKTVIYKVTNTNKGKVKYGIAYLGDNVTVKVYDDSSDEITGYIDYGETKFIKLYIENTSDSESSVSIKTVLGYENGGELEGTPAVPSEHTLVSEVYTASINFVDYLTNLYLDASPVQATVANNGINYYYAPTVNMMNDGMNSSHVWEDGANTGNIRYYGSAPANYIDIGDRDASGNVIPWRIIGVFKNMKLADGTTDTLVKVIRDEPIGNYSWDQSPENINNGKGINEWNQADLMKLLNPTYENEEVGGSLYWNSASGNCYGYDSASETYTSILCDFMNGGLSDDVKNKIEAVKWNLGGHNDANVFSDQIYEFERGDNIVVPGVTCTGDLCNDTVERKTIWEGKVALAYPSDYGYAVDFNNCSGTLNNYNNCIGDNWMHNTLTVNKTTDSWLLNPRSSDSYSSWRVSNGGNVDEGRYVNYYCGVSPILYLKSDLVRESGDGSSVESAYVVK